MEGEDFQLYTGKFISVPYDAEMWQVTIWVFHILF